MTVKDLILALSKFDPELEVMIEGDSAVDTLASVEETEYDSNILGEDAHMHHHYVSLRNYE